MQPAKRTTTLPQGSALQSCELVSLPVHAEPPCEARVRTLRSRVCVPPPQELLQLVQSPQSLQVQSTGHRCMPQACVSLVVLPLHGAPPLRAGLIVRKRDWEPPPQETLQLPKEPHAPNVQSTGHGCELHGSVSTLLVQGAPPLAAGLTTFLVRVCVPPAQVAEQAVKLDQLSQTQSMGHASALHTCVWLLVPLHGIPPLAC